MHTSNRNTLDETVSIFIVDDHPIVIEGIQTVVEKQSNYQVCGSGSTIQQALKEINKIKPTILISDVSLNQESGIDLVKEVMKTNPNTKILMMSMHDEAYYIEKAIRAGANGYILKSDTSEYLIVAIQTILSGKRYLHSELEEKLLNQMFAENREENLQIYIERLSDREKDIFQMIGKGKSTKDIANVFNISSRTVDSHKENIKKKLNKYSMNEVLEAAIKWIKL